MADIKISQLGAAIAVGDTDLMPIVSGGNTLKATAAQVKEHSIGNTNISGIGDGSVTGAISSLNSGKQPKTLATPLTIGGVSKTTVEAALGGLVSENQTLTNDEQDTRDSIAPTEDGTNYSKTYHKHDEFYHNGQLCRLTASSVNSSTAISNANYTAADKVTGQMLRAIACAATSGAVTAGTSANLGSLSDLTNGFITDRSQIKGILPIYAQGASTYDYGNLVVSAGNFVLFMPTTTQSNMQIHFSLVY